jgi:multiple sugar transport system ATP-binding protein
MNLLKGKVQRRDTGLFFVESGEQDTLTFPLKNRLEPLGARYVDKDIVFGIRPEHISNEPHEGTSLPVTLSVDIAEPMGSESLVYLKAGTGNLIARISGEHLFHLGEKVTVQLDLEKVSLFDPETEKVIR